MANATIGPATLESTTQTGNFNVPVTFLDPVSGFGDASITLTDVWGNGTTGVTFSVLPDDDMNAATYNVAFMLPSDVEGEFRITITGMVTPDGSSSPEAVMANSPIVRYDTTANVSVTLGTVAYREGGVVVVPLTFGENVIAPSKTICKFSNPTTDPGDGIAGIEDFYLVGEDASYELIIQIAEEKKGRFVLSFEGDVLKESTDVWDNVVNSQAEADRTFNYSTVEPSYKRFDIPANYTPGERFDVIWEYTAEATVNDPVAFFGSGDANYLDFFIFEGAVLSADPPTIYRKTDNTYPQIPIPENLGTAWTDQDLETEAATIYLLRWAAVDDDATGVFNMLIKPGFVRGPVS